MASKKRLVWLDMAKGLAIVLMVLGHCLDSELPMRIFIYSFHMPLFFVLAGFTMHAKPRMQVIRSSARRLLVPYFLVSAILLAFAFVPPSSISGDLDTQKSAAVVLVEILYGAGQEGVILGHHFQAIGALWFLPCLFVARIVFNEILLAAARLKAGFEESNCGRRAAAFGIAAFQTMLVAAVFWLGFTLGDWARLPFDIDTAFIAVGLMYVGYCVKRIGMENIPALVWVVLAFVWAQYAQVGLNEMAIRAYLENPLSLVTAVVGSLVVMRALMVLEKVPGLAKGLAWCGVSSLTILCVHRVESAVFNWQNTMEFFCPDVWGWSLTAQGLYQFGLRFALVICATVLVIRAKALIGEFWALRKGSRASVSRAHLSSHTA